MPSFVELGVEDITSFCNLLSLHGSKSNDHVTCVYAKYNEEKFHGSRWSFSWLGQKVNIAIAGVALMGGGDFSPWRIRPNIRVISAW